MYDDNQSGNENGSGSEYRYTGPFYSDNDADGTGSSGSGNYSYSTGGSYGYTDPTDNSSKKKKKEKREGGFGRTLLKTVCIALVFGIVASVAFQGTNLIGRQITGNGETEAQTERAENPVQESESTTSAPQVSSGTVVSNSGATGVADIVDKVMPSMVAITNVSVTEVNSNWGWSWGWGWNTQEPQTQEEVSLGTGIIIGQNDTELLIVSNYHVVAGATTLTVVFSVDEGNDDAEAVEAQLKGVDQDRDVSVLAVQLSDIPADTLSQIRIATIGDSSQLKVGDQVIAIGNALGYGQSVTTGVISALDREVTLTYDDGSSITNTLILTDAAINPGNSGGALLNMNGEVIGINEAKVSTTYAEGMGYAIPISDVEGIIGDLETIQIRPEVAEEDMGYLGITCQDVTSDVSSQYDMPVGIYVKSVVEGGAAERAGIKKGDIITKFDGVSVTSYDTLRDRMQYYAAGETVEVTVQSPEDGAYVEKTIEVTLDSRSVIESSSESE